MNIKRSTEIIEQVKESINKWGLFAKEAKINPDQIKAIKQIFLMKI
jgi:hypothetical protein